MSYDLHFYKSKTSDVTEENITKFLSDCFSEKREHEHQWIFESKETGAYFIVDKNTINGNDDTEYEEEQFDGFEPTGFSFSLNFGRPDFFGTFAFRFIDRFIDSLGLYVYNPQIEEEPATPYIPEGDVLYNNWLEGNHQFILQFFDKADLSYCQPEKTNYYFEHNSNIARLQEGLVEDAFVPSIFLLKRKNDGKIITATTWSEYIPNLFPIVDYYFLSKKRRKWFRPVWETSIMKADDFFDKFDSFLEDYGDAGYKIARSEKHPNLRNIFCSISFDSDLKNFAEGIAIEQIVNVRPGR
jgi:hypothetical protein